MKLLLLSLLTIMTSAQEPTRIRLVGNPVWSEEFNVDGGLDSSVWTHEIGNGNWGWGNGEVQDYTSNRENIKVENGKAVITVRKNGNVFTSARIKTADKVEFKYGSVEARISLPNLSDGLWPAFWLLGSKFSTVGWPASGEIDILEAGAAGSIASGKVNQVVSSAAHWDSNGYASYGLELDTQSNFADTYQTFRMDWTPNAINTFVDGKFIWAFDIGSCRNSQCSEFHEPFYFIANIAVGGRFTGIMDAAQVTANTPQSMKIDWIRIYNNEVRDAEVTVGGTRIYKAPPEDPSPTPNPTPNSTPAPTPNPTPQPVGSNNRSYDVDCGVPDTCTDAVLATDANGATCYSHIKWLMDERQYDEFHACDTVARKSFPNECGGCDHGMGKPFIDYNFDCGAPNLCNDNVLNQDAPDPLGDTCGERISYLIEEQAWSEADACKQVAGVEFPSECGECVHSVITCGKPAGHECLSKLDEISNGHTCRSRISWVVYATGATELEACGIVANEAGNSAVCGACDP